MQQNLSRYKITAHILVWDHKQHCTKHTIVENQTGWDKAKLLKRFREYTKMLDSTTCPVPEIHIKCGTGKFLGTLKVRI